MSMMNWTERQVLQDNSTAAIQWLMFVKQLERDREAAQSAQNRQPNAPATPPRRAGRR